MSLDQRLQRAVDAIGDTLRTQLTRELSSLNLSPPTDDQAIGRLADALRAMDHAKSLSDVLETLATAAGNESSRAGVFLISNHGVRSFRLFGFPAQYESAPLELPVTRTGVIGDAVQQRTTATSSEGPFDELPPDVKAIAIPLQLAGAPVGALYAEGADVATVEILARFASRALEALTAMKTARAVAEGRIA
jgi:hypothetical protein